MKNKYLERRSLSVFAFVGKKKFEKALKNFTRRKLNHLAQFFQLNNLMLTNRVNPYRIFC